MKLLAATLAALLLQVTPTPGVGSIEGTVLGPEGRPIVGSEVSALPVPAIPLSLPPRAISDSNGRFRFANLNAGSYRVAVEASGYAFQEYGATVSGRRGSGKGTVINLSAGRSVQGITVRLAGAGVISGRVRDTSGQPLVGIEVNALLKMYDEAGNVVFLPERSLTAMADMGSVRTNDRGEFRVAALTPGRYHVRAAMPSATATPRTGMDSERYKGDAAPSDRSPGRYAATYYPGVIQPDRAIEVEVHAGMEKENVDFALTRTRLYQVRGRALDAALNPLTGPLSFTLLPTTSEVISLPEVSTLPLQQGGTFELRDIAEGDYWVTANSSMGTRGRGYTRVRVVDADVDGVQIVLITGSVTISGDLRIDGQSRLSEAESQSIRVEIRGNFVPGQTGPVLGKAGVSADGSFAIGNLPVMEHRLAVSGLPRDFFFKEAHFGESDALSEAMQLNVVPTPTLNIVIARGTEVTGTVTGADAKPVANQQVVLIPEGVGNRPDLYKAALTDANGRFLMYGVAPGDYRAFAWKTLEPFRYFDKSFVRTFEAQGTLIHVGDTKATIGVRLIP